MGKDVEWVDFLEDDCRYADAINGIVFSGKQVVSEADLSELDTRAGKKVRDLVRKTALGVNFAIVGIENQDEMDYEFPIRIMEYDVKRYKKQVTRTRNQLKQQKEKLNPGEFLYGFKKDSRLHPVVTFALYSGVKKWDGPLSLHDIIDFTDIPDELRKLVADYRIHLIDIRRFKDTSVFKTDLRQVFDFIRCAEDKKALLELVSEDEYFKNISQDTYDVITKYANLGEGVIEMEKYKGEDGGINMCKGLRDLIDDSKEEGREELLRGIVINMLRKNKTIEEICDLLGCDSTYVEAIRKEIES